MQFIFQRAQWQVLQHPQRLREKWTGRDIWNKANNEREESNENGNSRKRVLYVLLIVHLSGGWVYGLYGQG